MRAIVFAAVICLTTNAARAAADECDIMAADIAKRAGLTVGDRTKANFIPMSPDSGEYGAYLNCAGPSGMSLRFVSSPSPPTEWYQFVGQSATILTKAPPALVRDGARQCVNAASRSPRPICRSYAERVQSSL